MTVKLVLPSGRGANWEESLYHFAQGLEKIAERIGFRVSARGWCYILEGIKGPDGKSLVTKAEFDKVEAAINTCRDMGLLAIDFTSEEEGRKFSGVEVPDTEETAGDFVTRYLNATANCERYYTPDWWEGEHYYIQMLVEKIDLKTLFEPICQEYHIPIATSKGWSSKLQRAEYARRFKEAEERGLKCVLLVAGDHDPDGLRITSNIRKNLEELKDIIWADGEEGYDPTHLNIWRFGLNYDFIIDNDLVWIDNLITGSGKNLADPKHKNHHLEYVQQYISKVGIRKCEANAIVKNPTMGRALCRAAIETVLDDGKAASSLKAIDRFRIKRERVNRYIQDTIAKVKITSDTLKGALEEAMRTIEKVPLEPWNPEED